MPPPLPPTLRLASRVRKRKEEKEAEDGQEYNLPNLKFSQRLLSHAEKYNQPLLLNGEKNIPPPRRAADIHPLPRRPAEDPVVLPREMEDRIQALERRGADGPEL